MVPNRAKRLICTTKVKSLLLMLLLGKNQTDVTKTKMIVLKKFPTTRKRSFLNDY